MSGIFSPSPSFVGASTSVTGASARDEADAVQFVAPNVSEEL
jgi:hypothetical protein